MRILSSFSVCLLCLISTNLTLRSQSKVLGDWEGGLNIGSKNIKIILHVAQEGNLLKTKMDSPDQGAVNIPFGITAINGDSLTVSDPKLGITIKASHDAVCDSLAAVFLQRGVAIPIRLGRSNVTGFTLKRPQTPKPPFPYIVEDVKFVNKSAKGIRLAGTLTIPQDVKNPCAAILVSGSGAQNRNEKAFDHEPFLIMSDHLSRNGIAVLRFDDRGTAESEGDFSSATSYDFSTDVEAALEFLRSRKDIDVRKIGLIGHSEGGMIVPMVAARNKDVAFAVSLAGPGVSLDKLMLKQIEDFERAEQQSDSTIQARLKVNAEVFSGIAEIEDAEMLRARIRSILKSHNYANGDTTSAGAFVKRTTSPWFRYFIRYNPAPALERVQCPFLALNGELDKQVNAQMNLEAMRAALGAGKNPDFTLLYMPGLNHGFQEAKTGNVAEYRMIEQTMSPRALEAVSKWIRERF